MYSVQHVLYYRFPTCRIYIRKHQTPTKEGANEPYHSHLGNYIQNQRFWYHRRTQPFSETVPTPCSTSCREGQESSPATILHPPAALYSAAPAAAPAMKQNTPRIQQCARGVYFIYSRIKNGTQIFKNMTEGTGDKKNDLSKGKSLIYKG